VKNLIFGVATSGVLAGRGAGQVAELQPVSRPGRCAGARRRHGCLPAACPLEGLAKVASCSHQQRSRNFIGRILLSQL